ncbi:hypothetical protein C8J57DRAFT_1545623 [Mycena rebaudengoi]|nr:hypothetical protein C8J57DRAFT_1545623 [Mycena rebaudengoi]
MAPETARVGPGIIYSQWALERTIGNLGEEIKQHSNAFTNLAHRALRRCQVNALKAMIPDLEPPENPFPRGSVDIGEGYVLLTATDTTSRPVNEAEGDAIKEYLLKSGQNYPEDWLPSVTRWSRVRLPNGQVARSAWKENIKPIEQLRCARNVKIECGGKSRFAELHFYMLFKIGEVRKPLAVVSFYGDHHRELYNASSKSYVTMQHLGDTDYAKTFQDGSEVNRYYLMEKPGLKLMEMMGLEQVEQLVSE